MFTKSLQQALGFALVCSAMIRPIRAQERVAEPRVVVHYCSGCHGADGASQLPYIPKLAGLSEAYLESKLADLREAEPSPVDEPFARIVRSKSAVHSRALTPAAAVHMVGVANGISQKEMQTAAQWYSEQHPAPPGKAKGHVIDQGKDLYMHGQQSRGLRACESCHGLEGQGTERAPRLAGQHATYIVAQLTQFRAGGTGSPMAEVARNLGSSQAQAIARYLQSR